MSVAFEQSTSLQALVGLALFFVSVLAHAFFRPFSSPILHSIEGAALVANWGTLYCGTLLHSDQVPKGFAKVLVTTCVVAIQVFYVGWSAVELYNASKEKKDEVCDTSDREGDLVAVTGGSVELTGFRKASRGKRKDQNDNGHIKRTESTVGKWHSNPMV